MASVAILCTTASSVTLCRAHQSQVLCLAACTGSRYRLGSECRIKARSRGNERTIDKLSDFAMREAERRDRWEDKHSPSTIQYVDVQTGAGAFSGSAANANALAAAINNNSGINSAIGGCNFLRVARYLHHSLAVAILATSSTMSSGWGDSPSLKKRGYVWS